MGFIPIFYLLYSFTVMLLRFQQGEGDESCVPPPLLSHQESEKLWLKKKKKDSQQVPETQQLKQKLNLQILATIFKEM